MLRSVLFRFDRSLLPPITPPWRRLLRCIVCSCVRRRQPTVIALNPFSQPSSLPFPLDFLFRTIFSRSNWLSSLLFHSLSFFCEKGISSLLLRSPRSPAQRPYRSRIQHVAVDGSSCSSETRDVTGFRGPRVYASQQKPRSLADVPEARDRRVFHNPLTDVPPSLKHPEIPEKGDV